MLLFHKVIADFEEVEVSSEHSSYRWVALEDLSNLNGLDGAYIESGYLEAIKKALSGLV